MTMPPPISKASPPPAVAPAADHPLSPRGRFARLAYLAWYLIITLTVSIAVILALVIFGTAGMSADPYARINSVSLVVVGVACIVFTYYAFVLTIRRLHDLNQSGWLSLLMLVPMVNVLFMLYVIIAPGNSGGNNFGLPRPNQGWEKVLGVIYIVMLILSLLGLSSMSYLMGYQAP